MPRRRWSSSAARTGIKPEILGLTLLAWGNSVGDYFTNVAMARKGLANMAPTGYACVKLPRRVPADGDAGTHGLIYAQALTACFAGPVFNLLVTLGVGFLIRLDNFQERRMRAGDRRTIGISVGLGMIIAFASCVVGAGLLLAGRVPPVRLLQRGASTCCTRARDRARPPVFRRA